MPTDDAQPETDHPVATKLDELKSALDEAVAARQRALADFANYQRRAADAELQAASGGAARVVRSMLGVLDHFDLALGQDAGQLSVEQLLDGVQIVRDELLKSLASQGVERIDPVAGDEFDPHSHEAVMRRPCDEVEPGTVAAVMQPGYVMGDLVLRPAKVIVAAPLEGGA